MGDTFNIPLRNSIKVPLEKEVINKIENRWKIVQNTEYHDEVSFISKNSGAQWEPVSFRLSLYA